MRKRIYILLAALMMLSSASLRAQGNGSYIRGDANLDGKIDMADIMFIVQHILNGKYPDEGEETMLNTPLTLEAIENGTITFWNAATGNVTYKIDGGVAQIIEAGTSKDIPVSAGQKVTLYGDNATYTNRSLPSNRHSKISSTAGFYVYGNIMSLISSTGFATATTLTGEGTFGELFSRAVKLRNHPSKQLLLPATTLAEDCYAEMFQGCTGLTTAPALPAMSVTGAGYAGMFDGCTSLTKAPELPATTLGAECYEEMFRGCTSLTSTPALPATTLADHCYQEMFRGCIGLTSTPALPATTLAINCYSEMFEGCTGLTTAPDLPATLLKEGCYYRMFKGCNNLTSIKCLATDISASWCTSSWLEGVSTSGTFVKAPSMTGWNSGQSGIPDGWTVETSFSILGIWKGVWREGLDYDIYIFNSDGTFKLLWQETAEKVYSGEESGTWKYDTEDSKLTLTTVVGEKPGPYTYTVVQQENQMTLIEADGDVRGPFTKQ